MTLKIKELTEDDAEAVLTLYKAASRSGTLGRDPDEYTLPETIRLIEESAAEGLCLGAVSGRDLVGEVHALRLSGRRFQHVVGRLTAAVHPEQQGRGVGRRLFVELLARIDALEPRIERTELMLQAANAFAVHLYTTLGFAVEGRLVKRVRLAGGEISDDLLMARFAPTTQRVQP